MDMKYSFRLTEFSIDELDAFIVMLHQTNSKIEDETHRDLDSLMHVIHVYLQTHADDVRSGVALVGTLIGWLREWRKRVAAENGQLQNTPMPQIELIRPDQVALRLRDASDEDVRRFFDKSSSK